MTHVVLRPLPAALAALACLSWTPLMGQELPPLSVWEGVTPGERRGTCAVDAGDLNGDGALDLWLGSPFDSSAGLQRGSLRAISGADGSALYTLMGSSAVDHFGWSAAALGDINGDGVCDLAVGAPDNDLLGTNAGAVRVVSGATGAVLFSVYGAGDNSALGYSVGDAGDVNGDGFADFHSGAPFDSLVAPNAGSVSTWSGRDGALLMRSFGVTAGDRLGISVSKAGDLNSDGRPDLLAGADQAHVGAGYVLVISGRTGAMLGTLVGEARGERFGAALCGGVDVDGDFLPDFAVGAPAAMKLSAATGAVRVFSGPSLLELLRFHGEGPGEEFGGALIFIADIDGDGLADLAASGAFEAGAIGAAGVVRATSSRSGRPLRVWRGRSGGDRFGAALASAEDRDGDGRAEILVGAPKDDSPAIDCGAVLLFSLRDFGAIPYCSAKQNSQGCTPMLRGTGYVSLSSATTLELAATQVLNNKPGLLLFGKSRAQLPFLGATLCVGPPIQRSSALNSGGSIGAVNCSGTLALTVDATVANALNWPVSTVIDAQAWYRDPQHPDGTASGLSDGLEFTIWL